MTKMRITDSKCLGGIEMTELVGNCCNCGKEVFCLNGFLNGILAEDKQLLCFECDKDNAKQLKNKK